MTLLDPQNNDTVKTFGSCQSQSPNQIIKKYLLKKKTTKHLLLLPISLSFLLDLCTVDSVTKLETSVVLSLYTTYANTWRRKCHWIITEKKIWKDPWESIPMLGLGNSDCNYVSKRAAWQFLKVCDDEGHCKLHSQSHLALSTPLESLFYD